LLPPDVRKNGGRRILPVPDSEQTGEFAALTAKNRTLSGPSEATTILTQGDLSPCGNCVVQRLNQSSQVGRCCTDNGRHL